MSVADVATSRAWDVFAEQMGEFQFPDNGNDWYAEQGMNVDGPTALWVTMKEEEVMFGCSFGIENAKQFGEYMIESTGDLGFSIRIQEDGDFRFIEPFIESDFCMIWNDEKAVLAGVENRYRMGSPRDKALEWLSLDEDDQLLSERDFQSLLNEDRDVSFWMNGGSVVQLMEPQNDIPDVLMDVFGEAVIGNLVSTLNFDEGSMTFEGWRTGNIDPSMGMFDQQFNKTLLSYVSADVPVVMSMAMNIDALEGMAEASMSSREWQELQLPLQMFGIDAFSDVLGGSAILALHGMELQETDDYGYYYGPQLQPVVSMLVEIESKNLLDQVSLMLDMQGLIVDEGDFYSMENPDGSDVYIDWDSSALLVTTDRETARNFERGGFGRQSLGGDSQVSADIAGSIVYAQIDWEGLLRESEMRGVQEEMLLSEMDIDFSDRLNVSDVLDKITIMASGDRATLRLNTEDTQMNSLAFLLETMLDQLEYEYQLINLSPDYIPRRDLIGSEVFLQECVAIHSENELQFGPVGPRQVDRFELVMGPTTCVQVRCASGHGRHEI